jgi:hypothetical protein
MVFKSKVDAWLVVLVFGGVAFGFGASVVAVVREGVRAGGGGVVISLLVIAFCVWLFTATDYRIDGRDLRIRSGPFRWRVAIDDIEAVTPSRNPLSSPALSMDRLLIAYAGGALLVSPKDREGFVRALRAVKPGIRSGG